MQKDKRKAYVKFFRLRDSSSKTADNRIKNHFERVIKFKKSPFYKSQLTKNQTSIRSEWKILNLVIDKRIFQHSLLIRDLLANDVNREPFKKAEAFNNYFINIPKKLRKTKGSIKAIKLTNRNLLQ